MTKKHGKMFTKQFRVSNGMNLKIFHNLITTSPFQEWVICAAASMGRKLTYIQ